MLTARQKQLLQQLADGEFHSGNELAHALALSRSAIWKQLQSFTELGFEIIAVSGKGYRLGRPLDLLDREKLLAAIPANLHHSMQALLLFDHIDSTNTYLMTAARQGQAAGTVCLAEYQSGGKGRRGRQWISPFGSNIYLSILWRFQQGLGMIAGLSLIAGIAVVRALHRLGYVEVGLKWPNDIYWQGKKLGGILVEASGEATGPAAAVIGVGLNVYLPKAAGQHIDQAWVDLTQISATPLARNTLAATLITSFLELLAVFENTPLSAWMAEWRQYDCMQGKYVDFMLNNQCIHGLVAGVSDEGLILMTLADGQTQAFSSGEITFHIHKS